ncbi:LacI family transcriptional regulator [Streptomyces gelaticus]|uniref:LacI family transcriptional regulator n=1 Tax=Streptomyces gelaticus TaxID=285446 RepID=A0ABQ2W1R1_9ACTN|nr:LacI family DNA-binding transcriptional regulator [Streptomyces gelaticus]GGV89090.1 LacI family transcriptional regulator [Streptomyces gelaticus]
MPGTTLADVARAAEVSTATVSHALNGTGRLSDSTRRRVREVATSLGYGSQRATRTGKTLGVAVTTYAGSAWNFLDVPYFARLLTAATATAHAHGYALTILPATCGAETPWHTLTVDGMLLLDSPTDDPVLRALRARGIPLVFDGRPVDPKPGDIWVDNDHTATTREVLGHLAASGAQGIALHAGYGDEHYTRTVTRAYHQWCHEHARTPLVLTFDPYDTSGHGFDAVFTARACDAVYTVYDPGGRQVLASAARHGLRIPDDLLLVCASEDQTYAENDPPVSTVSLHPATIAETAVTALVSRLSPTFPPPRPGPLTIPALLHPRRSSLRSPSGETRPGG